MRRRSRLLSAVILLVALSGLAPAARPCCQGIASAAPLRAAEIAPLPCCGTGGCAFLASTGSPVFVLNAKSSPPAPTFVEADNLADAFLGAPCTRDASSAVRRDGPSPGRSLFALHSQLLI